MAWNSSNTNEFIKKGKAKFGKKYNYTKVEYINDRTEVLIGCPVHGFIPMKPFNHLRNRAGNTGCKLCGKEISLKATIRRNQQRKQSWETILKRFKETHKDKFDYSKAKTEYIDSRTPITVICLKDGHREFKVTPHEHIRGWGCKDCQTEAVRLDLKDKKIGKIHILRTATAEEKKRKGTSAKDLYWWVKCACGRDEFMIATGNIIHRGVTSCSVCSHRDMQIRVKKRNWEKIKNKKFGRLLIHREWGSDSKSRRKVLCLCNCGSTHIAGEYEIKSGGTLSCGCVPKGEDSYSYFLENEEYAKSDCYFYVANIDNDFLKPGITNDLKERKANMKYRSYYFKSPKLCRCEAWTIEQIILFETLNARPESTPEKFSWWIGGQFEIRSRKFYASAFYQTRFHELLEEMNKSDWAELYLSRFGDYNN